MSAPIQRETSSALNYASSAGASRFPREILLRDRSRLRLRELRRADRDQLKAFFSRCSPEAIRSRFMSSMRTPSDSLVDYLADADGLRHVALVVTQAEGVAERIVAEGRYVIFEGQDDAADIAFLVVDDMQRRGIATLLIRELTEIARRNGVNHFTADVLADNRAMLSLLRKTGNIKSTAVSHGVIHFEVSIAREDLLLEAA